MNDINVSGPFARYDVASCWRQTGLVFVIQQRTH